MLRTLSVPMLVLLLCGALLVSGARALGRAFPAEMIAFLSEEAEVTYLYVLDLSRHIRVNFGYSYTIPVWSSEGRLAFTLTDGTTSQTYIWDGETLVQLGQPPAQYTELAWSNDGRLALVNRDENNRGVVVWDGNTLTNITPSPAWYSSLKWSSDGLLAFARQVEVVSPIYVWDGTALNEIAVPNVQLYGPEWSDDGRLAFASLSRTNRGLYVWGRDEELQTIAETSSRIHFTALAWSTDGRLAYVEHAMSTRIYVWDGDRARTISQGSGFDNVPMWNADGRLAFSASLNRNSWLAIWDGTNITNVMPDPVLGAYPIWSDDGRIMVASEISGVADIYLWDGDSIYNVTRTPNTSERYFAWWTP